MLAMLVYFMCGVTSIICSYLLFKSYRSSHSRLVFWTGICFAFFSANNILMIIDYTIYKQGDLSMFRMFTLVVGVCSLLYGLIWDSV